MATLQRRKAEPKPERRYEGADVPMNVIRRFARQVAERFHPDQIILFGSYAYGTPHGESDVDILVVMPCYDQRTQAARICWQIPALFPVDLHVRTPKEMKWRLAEGELFLTEVVSKGKILYRSGKEYNYTGWIAHPPSLLSSQGKMKRVTGEWVKQAEGHFLVARLGKRQKTPAHDSVCFHCQECAKKYLKGLLEEFELRVSKTHDLDELLTRLQPHYPTLRSLRRGLHFLKDFGSDLLYPGRNASKRQAVAAVRWAGKVRAEARRLLGIRPHRKK
jgi:HEPN domain-containing protein/predicted nucleotidyltransferase